MPVVRRRAIPAADIRESVLLAGAVNGVNVVFTTPDDFVHAPPSSSLKLYYNGQRLLLADDFTLSESGGPGTGFDTVTTLFPPKPGDKLWADYVAT